MDEQQQACVEHLQKWSNGSNLVDTGGSRKTLQNTSVKLPWNWNWLDTPWRIKLAAFVVPLSWIKMPCVHPTLPSCVNSNVYPWWPISGELRGLQHVSMVTYFRWAVQDAICVHGNLFLVSWSSCNIYPQWPISDGLFNMYYPWWPIWVVTSIHSDPFKMSCLC